MRLAIADPPYPPLFTERHDTADGRPRVTTRSRAVRWYGDKHPEAHVYDDLDAHRKLLLHLVAEYDGWAIATTPDGLGAYHPLPLGCRIMAWVRENAIPGGAALVSRWEPVIVFIPPERRPRAPGGLRVSDVLNVGVPQIAFPGAKPEAWTRWVLDALGYDPDTDTVDDLFPGSGAVTAALSQGVLL